MRWYWYRFHSLPVTVHALRDLRFRWQRIYGAQIGPWFIGAIRGREERPTDPKRTEPATKEPQR